MKKKKYSVYLIVISVIASLGGLLFGFDIAVISGVLPIVQEQFSLSPAQEGWFVSSALVGCILGVAFSGELGDRFGRKKMLVASAALFFVSALGCTFLQDISNIIIARIIGGVGIGIASIIVPLYISEIAPSAIRGRLVTCYQLAITIGILLAYLANAGLLSFSMSQQGVAGIDWINWLFVEQVWRGMFSMFVIPSLLFLIGLILIPESPRWLLLKGNDHKASDVFKKIATGISSAELEVQAIKKSLDNVQGSYKELLAPEMRKPLLLGLLLPLLSQLSGINAIIYYGPTILQRAGIPITESLTSQILFGAGIVLFTFIAIWKVDNLGRRKLYLFGSAGATIALFLTGLCFYTNNTSGIWLLLSVLLFLASFAFSIGPLKFVIAAEIFPNKIRGRAMALSIMVMWISDTLVGQITPIALNNWGTAATFWMFAAFCLLGFIVVAILLPETKGRSLEQIEDFWKTAH